MNITYNDTKKDLSAEQIHRLFVAVGWSDGLETPEMLKNYNIPFINSALVISAWDDGRLVGAVRVLSDKMFRCVIYDLLVLPEYQNSGIGKELVRRCIGHYPNSEWLVGCDRKNIGFYKKLGFSDILETDVFLVIPSKLFDR